MEYFIELKVVLMINRTILCQIKPTKAIIWNITRLCETLENKENYGDIIRLQTLSTLNLSNQVLWNSCHALLTGIITWSLIHVFHLRMATEDDIDLTDNSLFVCILKAFRGIKSHRFRLFGYIYQFWNSSLIGDVLLACGKLCPEPSQSSTFTINE